MSASEKAPRVEVYVDGVLNEDLTCTRASRGLGASGLGEATIVWAPHASKTSVVKDYSILDGEDGLKFAGKVCEVIVVHGGADVIVQVHLGALSEHDIVTDKKSLSVTYKSHMDHKLIGDPIYGVACPLLSAAEYRGVPGFTIAGDEMKRIVGDIVFNPEIDGRVIGNATMHSYTITGNNGDNHNVPLLWLPSQMSLSRGAHPNAERFTIEAAARYLCGVYNRHQEVVKNPVDYTPLTGGALSGRDALLVNHRISRNASFPKALDSLLEPYGFSWRLEHDAAPGVNPTIAFCRKGFALPADQIEIPMSKWREDQDWGVHRFSIRANGAGSTYSKVSVYGDVEERQHFYKLAPAWRDVYDDMNSSELKLSDDIDPKYMRVHRDWVLNEAYNYDRSLMTGVIPAADAFHSVWADALTHRSRRFEPMMETDEEGVPLGQYGGCHVVFYDFLTGEWRPISAMGNIQVRLLKHECGIRFTNDLIPEDLRNMLVIQHLRHEKRLIVGIFATVRGDYPLFAGAKVDPDLMLCKVERHGVFDMRDKYKKRILKDKAFDSTWDTAGIDSAEIANAAKQALLASIEPALQGQLNLTTVRTKSLVGKNIKKLKGRDIDLKTVNRIPGLSGPRYPYVTRQTWDFKAQETVLSIASRGVAGKIFS